MGRAEMSQYTGNVQVCVGIGACRPEFMAKSSKYYYFVVSVYLQFSFFKYLSHTMVNNTSNFALMTY